MNNKILLKLIPFIICFLFSFILSSCKKSGEHILVEQKYEINSEQQDYESVYKVNYDSIESADKQIHGQMSLKEHRVYYVDFSYSMVSGKNKNVNETGKTLLDLTKDSLKLSIRNIKEDSVYIEIIPFLDSSLWDNGTPKASEIFSIVKGKDFNNDELKEMDEFIDNIKERRKENGEHYNTHHSIAINDFINHRINNDNQYHMMILLTDGKDESSENDLQLGVDVLKEKWLNISNKYIFGIYVNLMVNSEISDGLPIYFQEMENNKSTRLFYRQGLNFDFDVFLLHKHEKIIEYRTNNIVTIPIGGSINCIPIFEPTIQEDQYYRYTLLEQPNKESINIRIQIDAITPANYLPNLHTCKLSYRYNFENVNNSTETEFITSGNTIELTILDEKTPNIKFLLPANRKDTIPCVEQRLEYCKKLCKIDPEWSDTVTIFIPYEKSDDAKFIKDYNKLKLSICEIPEFAELISKNNIYLDQPSDTVEFTLALCHWHEKLNNNMNFECKIKIENADDLNAIFVNGIPLNNVEQSNIISKFQINANECLHPLIILLIWLLVLMLILSVVLLLAVLAYRAAQPKFTDRIPVIQFGTEPLASYKNLNPNDFSFQAYGYLNRYIYCIRLDTSIQKELHKTWNFGNFLNIKRALQGDVHIFPLEENIFAQSIEFRPVRNGISIFVDEQQKCTITLLNDKKVLKERIDDGSLYKLIVYGLQQPLVEKDRS